MQRYVRKEVLIGPPGQRKRERSPPVIIGLGALGSVPAELLARAGVNLLLIDRDIVERSNLQRQLYTEDDVGWPKAERLAARLTAVNPDITIHAHATDFSSRNAAELLPEKTTIALDCADNLPTRFLLNERCLDAPIPWAHAACVGWGGAVKLFPPRNSSY